MPGFGLVPTNGLASNYRTLPSGISNASLNSNPMTAMAPQQTTQDLISRYSPDQLAQALVGRSYVSSPIIQNQLETRVRALSPQDKGNYMQSLMRWNQINAHGDPMGLISGQVPTGVVQPAPSQTSTYKPFTPSYNFSGAFTNGSSGLPTSSAPGGMSTSGNGGIVSGLDTSGMPDWLVQMLKSSGG